MAEPFGGMAEPPSLDTLPEELFASIAAQLREHASLNCLARTSRSFHRRVANADEAWQAAWEHETGGAKMPAIPAHEAVRGLATLDAARWSQLPPPPDEPTDASDQLELVKSGWALGAAAPRWREHACVLTCRQGRTLVLFGGRDIDRKVYFNDTWACDLQTGKWERVATAGREIPKPRCFNSDAGGARVLRHGGEEWAVLFGGLCQPGYRDHLTFLLGPLNEPPCTWRWMLSHPGQRPPQARFHHTLTVAPRVAGFDGDGDGNASDRAASNDVLWMVGGHNRMIQPILDMHWLSLHKATFAWAPREAEAVGIASSGGESGGQQPHEQQRVGVEVEWQHVPSLAGPMSAGVPPPRGFHVASFWRPAQEETGASAVVRKGYLVVSGGLGLRGEGAGHGNFDLEVFPLADTFVYDLDRNEWEKLLCEHPVPRSRAAGCIVRNRWLALAGGCRQASGAAMEPGEPYNDLWLLDLASSLFGQVTGTVGWERCALPSEGVVRPPHLGSSCFAVHGGAVLLILGGHHTSGQLGRDEADQFGDASGRRSLALHESQAIALPRVRGEAHPRISTGAARLVTAGMPCCREGSGGEEGGGNSGAGGLLQRMTSAAAAEHLLGGRGERIFGAGERLLVHGLKGAPELNGAIGVAKTECSVFHGADARLGVRIEGPPPHGGREVSVKRRNLLPSCSYEQPKLAVQGPPDAATSDVVWALTPELGQWRGASVNDQLRNSIVLNRLSVLPDPPL